MPKSEDPIRQYPADRAKRTLTGIDQQSAKAEKAIKGQTAIKRSWFVPLSGGTRTVNRELDTCLALLKGATSPTSTRRHRSTC